MADAKMLNKEKIMARLLALPEGMKADVAPVLKAEVDDLVDAMKRAAPVDEKSKNPGELRDSIHAYPNPDRDLSWRILVDAKDKRGHFIGPPVEFGHRIADRGVTDLVKYHAAKTGASVATTRRIRASTHVPPTPFFFPTYRARKKPMRRRLNAAGRKSAQRLFPGDISGN